MLAKSIILFVLAAGLSLSLSSNSIGLASAHPTPDRNLQQERPEELSSAEYDEDLKALRQFELSSTEYDEDLKALRQLSWAADRARQLFPGRYKLPNYVQQINSNSENHFGSEVKQTNVTVDGKVPANSNLGAETYAYGNSVQESDSSSKNFFGSRLTQTDVHYNFKPSE